MHFNNKQRAYNFLAKLYELYYINEYECFEDFIDSIPSILEDGGGKNLASAYYFYTNT